MVQYNSPSHLKGVVPLWLHINEFNSLNLVDSESLSIKFKKLEKKTTTPLHISTSITVIHRLCSATFILSVLHFSQAKWAAYPLLCTSTTLPTLSKTLTLRLLKGAWEFGHVAIALSTGPDHCKSKHLKSVC